MASKAADEQQAHVRALEEEVQNQLAADNIELTDVFDEVRRAPVFLCCSDPPAESRPGLPVTHQDPNAHDGKTPFDGPRDAHSTPRVRKHGTAAAERSLSEPAAEHGHVALAEPQPASDGVLSVNSAERHVRVSPELQQRKARASTAEAPSLSDQEATAALQRAAPVRAPLAAKYVRVLSLAEVIPSQADRLAASTLGSASTGSSGRPPQHSLDLTVGDGDVSRLRAAAADERAVRGPSAASTSGGRTDVKAVVQQQPAPQGRQPPEELPPAKTKIALSPRSAGMSAKDKRHRASRAQPSSSSRASPTDAPHARPASSVPAAAHLVCSGGRPSRGAQSEEGEPLVAWPRVRHPETLSDPSPSLLLRSRRSSSTSSTTSWSTSACAASPAPSTARTRPWPSTRRA